MKKEFVRILLKKGFEKERAETAAEIFADTSLDGVYSHGYQRFSRVIEYIEKGYIDVHARPEKITAIGGTERWDGHLGMGNLNARAEASGIPEKAPFAAEKRIWKRESR